MRRILSCAVAFATLVALTASGQTVSDLDLARSLFPARLANDAAVNVAGSARQPSLLAAVCTWQPGFIAAVYSNGIGGAVQLIARNGNTGVVKSLVDWGTITGTAPSVLCRDITGDGRPEVIASFADQFGTQTAWVFSVDGSYALTSIGPVTPRPGKDPVSLLVNPRFVDLNGDGRPEIITSRVENERRYADGSRTADATLAAYGLSDTSFSSLGQVGFCQTFFRRTSKPLTIHESVTQAETSKPAHLLILNGDDSSAHRVSSATVTWNGATVADRSVFNQKTAVASIPVVWLNSPNSLDVTLNGTPGSQITVVLLPN